MRTRPALYLATILGCFVFAVLFATPDAARAVDRSKYAGIQDDDSKPLPRYALPEDKQWIDQLLRQQEELIQPLALPGPPSGTLWTPGWMGSVGGDEI